mmetsp:Transcript_5538/g.12428  ORF Transcript_5538/g.12428 Transcript_5538/m.12428 type:complete len:85 (+) Transcript_5538:42-296(+)
MVFSLGAIGKFIILLLNAVAILHESVLVKCGLKVPEQEANIFPGSEPHPLKKKLAQFVDSVRFLLRWPLVGLNILAVLLTFALG